MINLFGEKQADGDIVERLKSLLLKHPEARNSYKLTMFWYWLEFDGLADVLPPDALAAFKTWLVRRATHPKTIQNRCGEVQNVYATLDADKPVRELRKRQARQGRVTK